MGETDMKFPRHGNPVNTALLGLLNFRVISHRQTRSHGANNNDRQLSAA